MLDFIGDCILWILALYGLIDIFKIVKNLIKCKKFESKDIFIIIATKNQEHKIEFYFRSIVFKMLYGKEENIKNIIVTDLNSDDNTKAILEKLSEDYQEIRFIDWEECKKELDKLNYKT